MKSKTVNLFFLGKGGVGKSTSSALTALHLASMGKDVLLVSMDPAHNQSDIFQVQLEEKPLKLTDNLLGKEVDIEYWIKNYLSDVEHQIKHMYSYLTALNLEKYLGVIKYSPGIEEYALLMAYKEIRKKFKNKDYIIFDMPPTALTLKFFGLPKLSILWLDKLLELRNEIIRKREIITKVKLGNKEFERDKILNRLVKQTDSYKVVKNIFEDKSKTVLNLVMNPDKLSFSESELIVNKLHDFDLNVGNLVINKYYSGFSIKEIKHNFKYKGIQLFPLSEKPLLGIDVLNNYLNSLESFSGML